MPFQRPRSAWRPLLSFLFAQLPGVPSGVRLEGLLPQEKDFSFYAGKYCFDFDKNDAVGEISIRLHRQAQVAARFANKPWNLTFVIYDDEKRHWKKIRKNWATSTCQEKMDAASWKRHITIDEEETKDYSVNIREKIRPRQWYFGFLACDGLDLHGVPYHYEVHARNWKWGWQQEFSLDHMGLYTANLIFAGLFCVTGLASAFYSRSRVGAQSLPLTDHPHIQLLLMAYFASCVSCAFFLFHYHRFIGDGYGSMRIRFLAVLIGIVANCTMYLMAVLSSCGWAITKYQLPHRSLVLGLVAAVGFTHLLCELHAELIADQSTQLYIYEGSAGVFILMLKVFMFCWFAFQSKTSWEEEPVETRRHFYKLLGIVVSVWFLSTPVSVIVAFKCAPWVRFKVVTIVDLAARFLGLGVFSFLFLGPSSPITSENTFVMEDDMEISSTYQPNFRS